MEEYIFNHEGCDLASYRWLPQTAPKATVFIAHGMTEHCKRYDEFAQTLANNGFAVFAHDHRGHGKTSSPGFFGHLADENGWDLCVEDIAAHIEKIQSEYPQLPFFLFGHSMGSFMSQEYIIRYSNRISGCILSGTNGKPHLLASLGRYLARIERFSHFGKYFAQRSRRCL